MKTDGVEDKENVGVVLSVDEDDLPLVGSIQHIYVVNNSKVVFSVTKFTTKFEPHFRAYLLSGQVDSTFVYQTDLFLHSPVHIRKSQVLGLNKYVILPQSVFA